MGSGDGSAPAGVRDDTNEWLRQQLPRLYPLNQLSESALQRLLPALRLQRHPAKAVLYAAGATPDDLYYVLEGCVCLYDREGWAPQLMVRPELDDEAMPLPFALPAEERAVVGEPSLILQVERALLEQVAAGAAAPVASVDPAATVVPEPPAAAVAAPAPMRSSRVLVVEHQADDAGACRALVQALGLRADWVPSAEEALELLQIERYGAVLLDLGLPGGDGFDVVKWIRAHAHDTPRPRVIGVVEPGHDDGDECLAAGFDGIVHKPLSAAALRAGLGR